MDLSFVVIILRFADIKNDPYCWKDFYDLITKYYHAAKPRQSFDCDIPIPQTKQPEIYGPSKLIPIPVLGGLRHRYIHIVA
jgi:hypothetical protein